MECITKQIDWAQKYRPQKLEDMILPEVLQTKLIKIRDSGRGPSMLFHGRAGTGKTTAARLLNSEMIEFNSSSARNLADVDNLYEICATPSVYSDYRLVLLDEADNYTSSAQANLRYSVEKLSFGNMFILTANNPDKLSDALHSRLMPINFTFNNADVALRNKMVDRSAQIIENEGLSVDLGLIKTIVRDNFPDMRHIVKRLQFEVGLV